MTLHSKGAETHKMRASIQSKPIWWPEAPVLLRGGKHTIIDSILKVTNDAKKHSLDGGTRQANANHTSPCSPTESPAALCMQTNACTRSGP